MTNHMTSPPIAQQSLCSSTVIYMDGYRERSHGIKEFLIYHPQFSRLGTYIYTYMYTYVGLPLTGITFA